MVRYYGFYSNRNKKLLEKVYELYGIKKKKCIRNLKEKKISHIVISHCGQEAGAYEVKKKLNKILPDCQIHIVETGGIASVYAGIGGIILAYA